MKVAAFYRFADVVDPRAFARELSGHCKAAGLLGTVLVAGEGINGTLTGDAEGIRAVLARIESALGLAEPLEVRWSEASEAPFRRLRVRVKREIVTLGRPDLRPQDRAGTYVEPAGWNALLEDPAVLVVDTRNRYEIDVGTFPGAIDPGTDSFRDFPAFAGDLAAPERDRPVAMFCTGGIRCEKATALLLELGFEQVYHLRGGVLRYLEEMADEDNRWQGECFVFDTRVAVDRDLAEGDYVQCHACRRPLGPAELASPDYREGVSCPHCIGGLGAERARRLEERRRQVALATARGAKHIGPKQGTDG
ncbi:MAG: rhodanese-related sulfurtransferase [Woeseiaceae bacterium]|nr:rhodanese-related sulfurtransferase [Woeseiaceae bacterium]